MIFKKITAMLLASCMLFTMAGCGASKDATGSGEYTGGTPTMQQIYAANTLESYQKAHIQPSFTSCLREGAEKRESNSLMTLYFDRDLGLICRFRKTETGMIFHYYFNRDGVDYNAYSFTDENGENPTTKLVVQQDAVENEEESYVENLYRQYSFGEYNSKETIKSCKDCGETFHIVTDISEFSFTDNSGSQYTYKTQEYDVEKQTLRILDTFRTYTFTSPAGESKTCTLSRSMTYGDKIISMPDFMIQKICDAEWSRELTVRHYNKTEVIAVPNGIEVEFDVPEGYDVFTDNSQKEIFLDKPDENGSYPNCSVYIGEK